MLCRILVTTIALLCTFSGVLIVRSQSTQRLVQIKDLICVLLLSGLQKEDLDVNVLTKLQRHNVNIDDMDNQNLRAECLSKSSTDISTNTERNDNQNVSTVLEAIMTKESEANGRRKETRKIDAQTVMTYFINARIDQERPSDLVINRTGKTNNRLQTTYVDDYTERTEVIRKRADIEYDNGQPKIESVLQFWNMYTRKDEIVTPTPERVARLDTDTEQLTKNIIIPNNKGNYKSEDLEYLNKIIAEYISNRIAVPTTAKSINTRQIYSDYIPRQINKLLGTDSGTKQFLPNINFDTRNAARNLNLDNYNTNDPGLNIPREENSFLINYKTQATDRTITKPRYSLEEEISIRKNKSIQYIDDVLKLNDQFKMFSPLMTNSQNTRNPIQNFDYLPAEANQLLLKPFQVIYNTKPVDDLYKAPNMRTNINSQLKALPDDLIKEIAQSVKAIVLKDLQKEVTSTTTKTTSVATTTDKLITTTETNDEKAPDANHVIEKFVQLYEQIKSMQEATSAKTYKMTDKDINPQYSDPLNVMLSPVNPYAMRSQPANLSPVLIYPHDQERMNAPILHGIPLKPNSVNKITQLNIFNHKNEFSLPPITLQTNSDEIPPLGIPISKPMRLLNQNIIVSTKPPYFETRNDQNHQDYMFKNRDYNNANDENRKRRERLDTYFNLSPHLRENDKPARVHFRDNKDEKFQSRNRGNSKYYNDHRSEYDTPKFDRSGYGRMGPRSYEVEKFHEQLERSDDWPRENERQFEDRENCCKLKVVSRHQLPLSDVKKRSRYDDTHFRNFLKTQEKVNNMLERILATKTKPDGPRSVETT